LPLVLDECETYSLTLREEQRLRVFKNRMLRRIFGPKREEDRSWRILHNDELHDLYSSPNIVRVIKSRRVRWAGHVARMGEGSGEVFRVLIGRPEGKRPLERPRRRWEDNIKVDLREIGIDGANWIRLAQDRVQWRAFVNTVMNLLVP
jgi:ribosomal protein L10